MFIKLTRLDNYNTPIWINAAFVVTVEPRKGGGSVVVPIGDGLDYDVRESPEQVLAMLGDAPAPAVVPVPAPKLLAPTPEDVSPDTEPLKDAPPDETPAEALKPAKRATRSRTRKTADGEAASKRTTRSRAKKAPVVEPTADAQPTEGNSAADNPSAEPETAKSVEPEPAKPAEKPATSFSDDQVARLQKMMPGSVQKLLNTLKAQFRVTDPEGVIGMLRERGVIALDKDHVIWN